MYSHCGIAALTHYMESVFVSWNGERGNYHNSTIARIPIIVHGVFKAENNMCRHMLFTGGGKYYFYKPTGVNNCAWLPLRPYPDPYPNDVQGDCEVRNLSRLAAEWRRSGRERRQPPLRGGRPFQGLRPHYGTRSILS